MRVCGATGRVKVEAIGKWAHDLDAERRAIKLSHRIFADFILWASLTNDWREAIRIIPTEILTLARNFFVIWLSPINHETPPGYEKKFADFIHFCRESNANGVPNIVVGFPSALGDNYPEIIESLSRLADAGLTLNIAVRNPDSRHN